MTSKQKKKPARTETVHQGGGAARGTHVTEFLRRAPRFTTLTNKVEGRERELSPSQRDFLDDSRPSSPKARRRATTKSERKLACPAPDSRRRPHASQRKSTLPHLLRPLQRHGGVVAALGPLEGVVRCRSAFGRVIPIRNHVDGCGLSKTAICSRTRWPPHRELLVALQYHLLDHQPLENVLGRDSFFQAEDRRGQRASGFVLELIPEDDVAAIGQVPPFEYAGPGPLQGLGRWQPIPLAPVHRRGAGQQVPQVVAWPGREGETVIDIEVALEAVPCPHAVQPGTAFAQAPAQPAYEPRVVPGLQPL